MIRVAKYSSVLQNTVLVSNHVPDDEFHKLETCRTTKKLN
jgi:hypothetical protein